MRLPFFYKKLYIMGGKPDGGYYKSMVELSRLYTNYKEFGAASIFDWT